MSLVGQQLGEFEIVEELGSGGMGTVYKARQVTLDRLVAFKTLTEEHKKNVKFIDRFRREARAAAALNHPNLVHVYSADVQGDGLCWFAMEYVEGVSAQTKLDKEGRFDLPVAINIGMGVAAALDHAWTKAGLIHRDIKPANIFLSQDGHVKLGDLGIAKSTDQAAELTTMGGVVGTPGYMSPEQIQSKPLDLRADIYSLGCTLFHLLSGKLPFAASDLWSLMAKHVNAPVPDLKAVRRECPSALNDLIARMMQKDPEDRPQDYRTVIAGLQQAYDATNNWAGSEVEERPKSPAPGGSSRASDLPPAVPLIPTVRMPNGLPPTSSQQPPPYPTLQRTAVDPSGPRKPKNRGALVVAVILLFLLGYWGFRNPTSKPPKPVDDTTASIPAPPLPTPPPTPTPSLPHSPIPSPAGDLAAATPHRPATPPMEIAKLTTPSPSPSLPNASSPDISSARSNSPPEAATRNSPFVNSLGMKFVPVPGTNVLFSVWDTRVQDYDVFAQAKGIVPEKPPFEQDAAHPVVRVDFADAHAFCAWLSQKENLTYRLPTDAEWSLAVGLGHEQGATPAEKSKNGSQDAYPWGKQWPPPDGAGNYGQGAKHKRSPSGYMDTTYHGLLFTTPVGSFPPNRYGLYDMSGNVWQWCEDLWNEGPLMRVMRGGSYSNCNQANLRPSFRFSAHPDGRHDYYGFRCVLVTAAPTTSPQPTPEPNAATASVQPTPQPPPRVALPQPTRLSADQTSFANTPPTPSRAHGFEEGEYVCRSGGQGGITVEGPYKTPDPSRETWVYTGTGDGMAIGGTWTTGPRAGHPQLMGLERAVFPKDGWTLGKAYQGGAFIAVKQSGDDLTIVHLHQTTDEFNRVVYETNGAREMIFVKRPAEGAQ